MALFILGLNAIGDLPNSQCVLGIAHHTKKHVIFFLPKTEINPHEAHTMRERPTLPEPSATPVGEINMPEPETIKM